MTDIKLVVSEAEEHVNMSVDSSDDVTLQAQNVVEVITSDYRKLNNKPTINNTELYDNYDEIDPTVPNWAKGEEPSEMSIAEIYDVWSSVFK